MSRVLLYQGTFVNTETTRPGNVNIQQTCVLNIYDTEAIADNPYGIAVSIHDNGDGTQSVQFSIDSYPDETLNLSIQYSTDNGGSWIELGVYGPTYIASHTIPTGEYLYQLIFFTISEPAPDGIPYILNPPAVEVIPLEMTDAPVVVSVIDNEEDAFTPVRSKQLEASVYSGNGVDIASFADGGDQRWYVEYLVNNVIKFIGFLSISDLSQDIMPDPNVINLVATDGLGFLSDIPLTDFDEVNPTNERKIMDYIAWSLRKTGLELPIVVCMNIRERFATPLVSDDTGDGHFYKWNYLDAKTFEDEIGTSEDCRTVLEKIFKEMCNCEQDNGTWFIMRKDEMDFGRPYYLYKFDFQGNFIEATEENFEKNIGVDLPLSWMEDARVLLERAYKLLQLTYNYVHPKEIPCNVDFARGSGDSPTGSATETTEQTLECWQFLREGTTPAGLDTSPFAGAYGLLRKDYEYGYEKSRYIALTVAGGFRHYFKSENIFVQEGDNISIGYSFRLSTSETMTNMYTAHVRLIGDDGFVYDLDYDEPTNVSSWNQKVTTDAVFDNMFHTLWTGEDTLEWHTLSMTAPPMPVSGTLNIRLVNGSAVIEVQFADLTFKVDSYKVNGSYRVYSGQRHSAEQLLNTVAARKTEVFISDSPRRDLKGSILKEGGTDYVLANEFYDASLFPNADFTDDDIRPFGELQLFDVWNQINRLMRRFDGVIDGLESNGDMPDLKYKYFLTDANQNTDNKMFMLLHFEQEQHLCEQTSFLTEVADSTINKVYTGNTFKYITSGE